MKNCNYVYDAEGLRWEEGSVTIALLVGDAEQHFKVVRNGSGSSRITRFTGKSVPHPGMPETYLYGEITGRDLDRILTTGFIDVMVDGNRTRISHSDPQARSGLTAQVVLNGPAGPEQITRRILPGKLGGSGRIADRRQIEAAILHAADGVTGGAATIALSQMATLPKSARAGAAAARARLHAATETLLTAGEYDNLIEAFHVNPDAALHLTPELYLRIDALSPTAAEDLEDAVVRGAVFAGIHGDGPGSDRVHALFSACRIAKSCRGGNAPDSEDAMRITGALTGSREAAREALEMLVREPATRRVAAALLAEAARTNPGRALTAETALMLSRVGAESNVGQSTLEHLAIEHPETLGANWLFLEQLPDYVSIAIEKSPLSVATAQAAPMTLREQAVERLLEMLGTGDDSVRSRAVRSIEDLHPQHAKRVAEKLQEDGVDLPTPVRARLDLAWRAWEDLDNQGTAANEYVRQSAVRILELENKLRSTVEQLGVLISAGTRSLLAACDEARALGGRSEGRDPHERDAVRLRVMLRTLQEEHPVRRRQVERILQDVETIVALLLEDFRDTAQNEVRIPLLETVTRLRDVVRRGLDQSSELRYPDRASAEWLRGFAARTEMVAMEAPASTRGAVDGLCSAVGTLRRRVTGS